MIRLESKVINQLESAMNELDSIETYLAGLDNRRSDIDTRLSDVLHFIENIDEKDISLTPKQCYHLIMFIRDLRVIRRGYAQEQQLRDVFVKSRGKIVEKGKRKQFISEIKNREQSLDTIYKPRLLDYDTILELITVHGRGRKPKNKKGE